VILLEGEEERQALAQLRPGKKNPPRGLAACARDHSRLPGLVGGTNGAAGEVLAARIPGCEWRPAGPGASVRIADSGFEDYICGSSGPLRHLHLPAPVMDLLAHGPTMLAAARSTWADKFRKWPSRLACRCAPLYEPVW
jgi:hypothetical protein